MCIQCLRNPCAFCAVGVSRLTVERPSSNRKRKRDEATEHCASDVEKRGSCFLMMFSFWFATFEFFLFNQDEGSLVSWHLQLGVHQQCRARIRSMSLGSGEKHKQGSIACYRRAESKTDFFFTLNGLASSLLFYSLLLSDLAISSEIWPISFL